MSRPYGACAPHVILNVVAGPRYGLLGPLEVRTGDTAIRPSSYMQRLLLAVLLVDANRVVPADRLVEELWGDALPTDPASALRTQVSRLRRVLGPGAADLGTEAGGYRICLESGQLDAAAFEDLVTRARETEGEAALELFDTALGLWRGRALEEFSDRPFAQSTAVRLEELRSSAREDRARILLAHNRTNEVVAALEELVSEQPEREHARALLMEALYMQGRHTEALETYQWWRRRLADELGLDPSPELVRLEREILSHTLLSTGEVAPAPGVPMPVSSFVGREQDVEAVVSLLEGARLVTLCGPGGVGKTRLALEVVRRVGDKYADGVRLCDLLGVRRPTSVARAIATAVGLRERGRGRIEDQLVEYLGVQRLLVVLDNCEHVVAAAAAVARCLLEGTHGVDVLATSRERLAADGEHVWSVTPLASSGPDAPAVHLFRDRACAVDPSFGSEETELIGSICARLDGLPLAIELAAARLPGLTLTELAARLDHRLRLLTQDNRPDIRHRSLRAVVDWSYEHLSSAERRVFERLGVFAGRFDIDAARAVGTQDEVAADEVAGLLLGLVDRSLVVVHSQGAVTRYALLDTLRTYAGERLAERGDLDAGRDVHARWAVELAERAAEGLAGPDEASWADALESYFDELRAAHIWLVGRDVDLSLRLVAALHWFALWYSKSEVFRWAEVSASAAAGGGSPLVPTVLGSAAAGACQRGELDDAEAFARAALDAARDLDPGQGRRAIEGFAEVCLLRGDLERSAQLFQDAYERSSEAGDTLAAVWEVGSVALSLAYAGKTGESTASVAEARTVAEASGSTSARAFAEYVAGEVAANDDPEGAQLHLREAIRLGKAVGSRLLVGLAEVTLATLLARHHDPAAALSYYEGVILRWRETTAWMPLSVTLRTLVALLTRLREFDDAALLYGAVQSGRFGPLPFGQDEEILRGVAARLGEELGADGLRQRTKDGGELSIDRVVELALRAVRRAAARARVLLAEGFRRLGNEESARLELRAALSTFDRLGAQPDARRVRELLGEEEKPRQTDTKTFMFTDIVRSTELAHAMGDDAWEGILRWHDDTLRSQFAEHRGEEVKHTGDGFFVAFDDSRAALDCAVAIQKALERHRREHGFAPQVRVGLHSAKATRRGSDYTGSGVNTAARIGALAEGGEILASVDTTPGVYDVNVSEPKSVRLKGVKGSVDVVTVKWR